MNHEALIIPRNGRLDNLIEEFIRNWGYDPTGLDKVLRSDGENIKSNKSNKSNKTVHASSSI